MRATALHRARRPAWRRVDIALTSCFTYQKVEVKSVDPRAAPIVVRSARSSPPLRWFDHRVSRRVHTQRERRHWNGVPIRPGRIVCYFCEYDCVG